jgi:uncharacterized membrane protein YphA (DoxX/SURF4 family)
MTDAAPTGKERSAGWTILEWWARIAVGLLFIYTGYTKLVDPATFVKEVRTYTLMPLALSNVTALVLPWIEIIAGLLLITAVWRREARVLLGAMLVVFIAAKAAGYKGDCGCVPTHSFLKPLFEGWRGFATNAVLLILLLIEAYLERLRRRPAPPEALPGPGQEPASA